MGNNMVKTRSNKKYAKVMNINGQISKIPTPSKVFDVIKDYPHHVLLDSNDFLRFNLRANPLDPDYQLRPKKLYLLVQLPKLDRVGSLVGETGIRDRVKMTRRSVSDLSGQTRVKITLPKAVVDRIMAESSDDLEVAKRILRLHSEDYAAVSGGDVMAPVAEDGEERERREGVAVDAQCFKVTCSPYHRKYKRLIL